MMDGMQSDVANSWTRRIIHGGGAWNSEPPNWLMRAYSEFRRHVTDPAFPCFFGMQAETRGEMFYSFASAYDLSHLPATLAKFATLSTALEGGQTNLAVFFEPDTSGLTHEKFQGFCWSVLQYLHNHDNDPAVMEQPDPADAAWEFCFAGIQMFVVGCSPTYCRRRSRNIGPGLVMLFQPRSVFSDASTKHEVRAAIRRRLVAWDGVAAHADLGVYGDPDNREWKQYFLPDTDEHETGACPFRSRRAPFQTVVARISEQAALRPAVEAVSCEDAPINYGALELWSNQIGRRLKRQGVGAEIRVGLCVERSLGLVAGLLAVLKAGGAFVPLDPAYPSGRLADMVADSMIEIVVADRASADKLADLLAGQTVVIVTEVDDEDPTGWHEPVHPQQLAYVIYTSGSTGRPKGVAISQHALSLHMADFLATYGITQADKMLQSSTINFDVALHELLPALMVGGQVEMRGPDMWDLATLTRRLAEARVSFARIPTAYWQQWLHALPNDLASLRQITVGGEGLPGDALARWHASPLAQIRLDNLYGPTETTIACLFHQTGESDGSETIVPIGQPFPSRTAYVMDADGHEAPTGELCIGGDTLARGYLNRPSLTAERFVPDPSRPGGRLYRTGDLCRRLPDGTVVFLGRLDQQIKLRGFRIELGEIEAAMRRCPGVRESVAIVAGEHDQRKIIGYVTGLVESGEVRRSLRSALPEHMVPSAVVVLEALPLMPNGKLDRASLPLPQTVMREQAPPETDIERRLARLWEIVLNCDVIDRDADFFELGGHSLLALRLIALVESEFGCRVGLAAFYKAPSIARFAEVIKDASTHEFDFRQIVQLYPNSARPPLFGINSTGAFYHLAKVLGPEFPVIGLQLFDPARPPTQPPGCVKEIAAGYVALMRRMQPTGPYHLFGWSMGGVLAFEVAQQLAAQGAEIGFLGILDTWAPGYAKRLKVYKALLFAAVIQWRELSYKLRRIPSIITDLFRVTSRKGALLSFLAHHQTLARLLFPSYRARIAAELARNPQTQYDLWLRNHLARVAEAYVPSIFAGQIHLFRAAREVRPPMSDAGMGWQALTAQPLQRADIASDHASICRPPAVNQTASVMLGAINSDTNTSSKGARNAADK